MCQEFGVKYPGFDALNIFFDPTVPPANVADAGSNDSDNTGNWDTIVSHASLNRPRWAAGIKVWAKVNAYSTSDLDDEYRIRLAGGSTITLDETRVTAPAISSVAFASAYLCDIYYFTNASTVTVTLTLEGKNYETRANSNSTKLFYQWLPYPAP